MAWNYTREYNVELGGCRVYIDNVYIGYTSGECGVSVSPQVTKYYRGYPKGFIGSEIQSLDCTLKINCLELCPNNLMLAFPDAVVNATTNEITFGADTQPVTITNIKFVHEKNPLTNLYQTIEVWKAQPLKGIELMYDQETEDFDVVSIEMDIICDKTNHPTSPYFKVSWESSLPTS